MYALDNLYSPSHIICGIVGNVPYNMGEESSPRFSFCLVTERPTGTTDRRFQIGRSRRWLQVGL